MKKIGKNILCFFSAFLLVVYPNLINAENVEGAKKPNQYSIGSLLSYHMFMNYNDYRPKLTKNGRVVASPLFLRMRKTFDESEVYSFFTGNDSIGYPLVGAVREFSFLEDERASSTGYLGFYFIYDHAWRKEVNHPAYYATIVKDYLAVSMPLIGVRNSLIVYKTKEYFLSVDLLISIGLVNAGIFVSF